jgi:probable rRNA maturation factor
MPDVSKVKFHYVEVSFAFAERERLKVFLLGLFKKEGKKVKHINYIFCKDGHLLSLNEQYLNHNTLTDIITFELSDPGQPLIADIYISSERVRENAALFATPFYRELHRVIFHGALHLCGYKDKNKQQTLEMRSMEEFYLNRYFVPRGTNQL